MIDEKKLIDELKQSGMITDNEYGNAMVDMIENQPQIGVWIPCSERMPECGRRYLVTAVWRDRDFKIHSVYDAVYGSDKIWHTHNYEPVTYEVIAWQPLPEAYQESLKQIEGERK